MNSCEGRASDGFSIGWTSTQSAGGSPGAKCSRGQREMVQLAAFVWLFSSVNFQMSVQIACLRKGIFTLVLLPRASGFSIGWTTQSTGGSPGARCIQGQRADGVQCAMHKQQNKFSNLDKYILLFEQIHFLICTNTNSGRDGFSISWTTQSTGGSPGARCSQGQRADDVQCAMHKQ